MSEYWVSQGRRMCTYCKCWTADNKASINFHEQGKNHKENVIRKLDELRKKGMDDARSRETESSDMAKIERAALESLKKDMAENNGISSAYGIVSSAAASSKSAGESPSVFKQPAKTEKQIDSGSDLTTKSSTADLGDWTTAHSDEGHLYYWNSVTNETSWYPPGQSEAEGDVESVEQEESASSAVPVDVQTSKRPEAKVKRTPQVSATTGFGQWETVTSDIEQPETDYDLPTDSKNNMVEVPEDIPLPPTEAFTEEPEKKFKVKKVVLQPSSKDDGPVAFKKPKFAKRRQMRGALDDD